MIKKIIAALALIATVAVQAAEPQTYRLDVKDFGELQVVDDINVVYRSSADSAGFAVFTATPDAVSHLMFTNNKNKLKIQVNADSNKAVPALPVVTVYSNYLVSVENSGDSTVTVHSPAPGAQFKARVVGNGTLLVNNIHSTKAEGKMDTGKGHLVMSGVARAVDFRNIGTGRIEAGNLTADNGAVTILGTGPVDCAVKDELVVKGMGTGKVYVKGTPKVKNRSLGTIKVINVE